MAEEQKEIPITDRPQPADNQVGVSPQNAVQEDDLSAPKPISMAVIPQYDKSWAEREMKAIANVKPAHLTDAIPGSEAREDDFTGVNRQIRTVKDWLAAEENRPETKEEREKRERKEKSKRIIAAVSDGLSALSNLYFTSQYAPNMYNHEKGMKNALDARLERLKADREKNADKYLQFSLKLGDLEKERAKTLHELKAQQEAQKIAREKAQREANLFPDKQREAKGKADKAEQEAITAAAEAKNAPDLQEAKLDTERSRKRNYDASAAAHGRSNVREFSAWDERGREHKFRTKEAAESFAKQHGTWEEMTETTSTDTGKRDPDTKIQNRTSTKTKKGGYAGKTSPTAGRKSPTA